MSELLALGISHKTAPVALRERLAFTEREASEFALQATASTEVRSASCLATISVNAAFSAPRSSGPSISMTRVRW